MQRLQQVVTLLIKKDRAYADTLAIELNQKLQSVIDVAITDIQAGRVTPLVGMFKDYMPYTLVSVLSGGRSFKKLPKVIQ